MKQFMLWQKPCLTPASLIYMVQPKPPVCLVGTKPTVCSKSTMCAADRAAFSEHTDYASG